MFTQIQIVSMEVMALSQCMYTLPLDFPISFFFKEIAEPKTLEINTHLNTPPHL